MVQALPTAFVDDAAEAALATRIPAAVAETGANIAASCAPGIGISTQNPNLDEALSTIDGKSVGSWSLLDQHGGARNGQIGQLIGGNGVVPRVGNVPTTWDKSQLLYTDNGAASSGGVAGILPEAVIRMFANPDNVDAGNGSTIPDNTDPIVVVGNATLTDLDAGWTSV